MTPQHANTHGMTLFQKKSAYPEMKCYSVCPVIVKSGSPSEYCEYVQDGITKRIRKER